MIKNEKKSKRAKDSEDLIDAGIVDKALETLIDEMANALEADIQANNNKQIAF